MNYPLDDIVDKIKASQWWESAEKQPDRHFESDANISLADHLLAVYDNLNFLDHTETHPPYFKELHDFLFEMKIDVTEIKEILEITALLHDLGNLEEDKTKAMRHPLTGGNVKMIHPVISVKAAIEILPADLDNRDLILSLINEHDTPYSWHLSYKKSGTAPRIKSWHNLDKRVFYKEEGYGLILLAIFKMADIHGHDNVDDVIWFIDNMNNLVLNPVNISFPSPDSDAITEGHNI